MFFADNLAPFVDELFFNPIGLDSFAIILGTIGFGIQIYCDFSGYSDIAIGAALILGFKIPANFNFPMFATSPSDYWTRWHISLSSWVRDYLYYPLVFKHRRSSLIVFLCLLASMLVMGLWHGASWNFIIWGGLHGIFLAIFTVLRKKYAKPTESFFKTKFGKIFSIIATQYLVFFTFIAFRIENFDHMLYAMQKYVFFDFQTDGISSFVLEHKLPLCLMILFVILHFVSYNNSNLRQRIASLKLSHWIIFLTIMMTAIIFFYDASPRDFIYFKF